MDHLTLNEAMWEELCVSTLSKKGGSLANSASANTTNPNPINK